MKRDELEDFDGAGYRGYFFELPVSYAGDPGNIIKPPDMMLRQSYQGGLQRLKLIPTVTKNGISMADSPFPIEVS
jgi:hypothetical protein